MTTVRKLTKAECYQNRIFTIEYDLAAMIEAYGARAVHWLVDQIEAGEIKGSAKADQWAAHEDLYKFASTLKKSEKVAVVKRGEKVVKRGAPKAPKQQASA